LTQALRAAGYNVRLSSARTGLARLVRRLESQPTTVVFLTVPDNAVAGVAADLAAAGKAVPETVAFVHASGALELRALAPLRRRHAVGSFHPLRSFPEPQPPQAFRGIVIGIDASSAALGHLLDRIARDVGAKPRRVDDSERAIYHAAAVFASNYLVVLLREAVGLLQSAGWTEKEAIEGLLPLAQGALDNVRRRGPAAALTGPIRRGDARTVRRHLDAMAAPDAHSRPQSKSRRMDLYRMLGQVALEIAKEAGLEPAAAEQTRRALTRKVAATRRRSRP
jgi:predicted short-subunit dehydrogenase-like oxidoreductase (DUF2520 family)